ncbi:hypothetical protein LCGC14_0317790 [marine sediment metagenome]|uniref:Uncharacterized protein n=1 Tax=marine sediment metagenome TaxID=412755 RepID=A0A0F9TJX4_9ZZZZ
MLKKKKKGKKLASKKKTAKKSKRLSIGGLEGEIYAMHVAGRSYEQIAGEFASVTPKKVREICIKINRSLDHVEINILDPKSIKAGMKILKKCQIAMPWTECMGSPPAYVRNDLFDKEQLAIVDPTLDGHLHPHGEETHDMWGWKTNVPSPCGSGHHCWGGICETAEEARAAADRWLSNLGYILLEG